MSKFTKGPWHEDHGSILDADDNELADASIGKDTHGMLLPVDARIANAKLFAAAPELLEALKVLVKLGDLVPVFQLDNGKSSVKAVRLAGDFIGAMDAARATIAKAIGGAK